MIAVKCVTTGTERLCTCVHESHVCSCSEYEQDMKELQDTSILDIVLALQRQGAIGNFKNSRYCSASVVCALSQYGVQLHWWLLHDLAVHQFVEARCDCSLACA